MALLLDTVVVGTPIWWVNRLYQVLLDRRPIINMYDDYYRGDFPLPWLAPQAADPFRRILKMSRANYIGLIVDAQCERMAVEGFRINEDIGPGRVEIDTKNDDPGSADREMQRIWQANQLDTYFDQALLEATITGNSYLMVEPNDKDPKTPHIFIEHSSQVAVAFRAGSNRREAVAALKVWQDEWTGQTFATLFLQDTIHKYQSDGKERPVQFQDSMSMTSNRLMPIWDIRPVKGELVGGPNRMGMVPIWELPNNPRLLSGGQSEMYDLTDTQDRIVKTIVDRMMAQDFGAFPQKWISGWPEEDASGDPLPDIEVGRDRVITTEVAETKFGQFSAENPTVYITAKESDITDMASRSRTPAQYLLGSMNNVNGDTLKASESGLVAKVRQRMRGYNDPLESAMRAVRGLAGISTGGEESMEVIWRNPEFRTEGELVDALLKMADLGVPEEALWEKWGATPTEVVRWKGMLEDKMQRAAAGDATVILAERFRAAAAGPIEAQQAAERDEKVAKAKANGGGTNDKGTQPGQPRGTKGPGNTSGGQSGGNSSASAAKRRSNAPKPSTT